MNIIKLSIVNIRLSGRYYYMFDGRNLLEGYPKPLTELGLPEELDHVDAVTIWGHSNKTYIFRGNVYWKYDEKYDKITELDYPKEMSVWKGVEYNIDAAFRWLDGKKIYIVGSSGLHTMTLLVKRQMSFIFRKMFSKINNILLIHDFRTV